MLIVDDEKTLCETMQSILKDDEFKIDCAFSLKEGKLKWQRDHPQIVLLENFLSDGRGIDMIESDRSLLSDCKVIMVTADNRPLTRSKAESLGIHYFIQKPLSLKLIKELMDQVIDHPNQRN